jgi:tRNA(Ile)-lysidine synthase
VGFSGGVDSVVLLDALAAAGDHPLSAIHVHHGLSPDADAWADFCRDFCAARGVPVTIERVTVDRASAEGLEAAARRQRYAIYAARPERYVALAHHLDDQAETVLLQLLRGTGLKGVAAMPALRALPGSRVEIVRPLLDVSRAQIVARAKDRGLAWIEDESNKSTRHDRNYLRHDVAPLLDARFPGWRDAVARFAKHAASADAVIDEIARDDGPDAETFGWGSIHAPMYLHFHLTEERRANALRSFLARNGLPMPSTAQLAEMGRQLYDSRDDAQVRFEYAGVAIRRHRRRAYVEIPGGGEPWRVDWLGEREVPLGGERGTVCFYERAGEGIDPELLGRGTWYFAPRTGGEKIRLAPQASRRTLKNLFQERGIPGDLRRDFPCLFNEGQLVWVAGVGCDAQYQVGGTGTGLFPTWRMASGARLC